MRRRALTPAEVGMVLAVVLIVVACCCGLGIVSTFHQPKPVPVYPVPTGTY